MAFVGKEHILDGNISPLQVFDHLLGFDDRVVRVVRAMQHDGRCAQAFEAMNGTLAIKATERSSSLGGAFSAQAGVSNRRERATQARPLFVMECELVDWTGDYLASSEIVFSSPLTASAKRSYSSLSGVSLAS